MAYPETLEPAAPRGVAPSAVVWISEGQAIVAVADQQGQITTCEISRGSLPETPYLAQVVHAIGDRERVVILGAGSVRLALEREYVALFRRPERLVDVEPSGSVSVDDLVSRLRALGR